MNDFFEAAAELCKGAHPFVTVTLVAATGHVPQNIGAKMIVTNEGLVHGTVGGGKVEAKAIDVAKRIISMKTIRMEIADWNLTRDIGMTCGGEVRFLFEKHEPRKWQIVIYGAGHVAQALCRVLESLDCHLTFVDSRPEWLDKLPSSLKITKILAKDLPSTVTQRDAESFFVVMTQGHASDLPVLEKIFKSFPSANYIGVMGSDVKALKLRQDLRFLGVEEDLLQKLQSPIGLPIGSNSPPEIAISIVAQLLQYRKLWEEKSTVQTTNNLSQNLSTRGLDAF